MNPDNRYYSAQLALTIEQIVGALKPKATVNTVILPTIIVY